MLALLQGCCAGQLPPAPHAAAASESPPSPLRSSSCFLLQAVYGVLKEAEHRSTFYIPYWNLPLASVLGERASTVQLGQAATAAQHISTLLQPYYLPASQPASLPACLPACLPGPSAASLTHPSHPPTHPLTHAHPPVPACLPACRLQCHVSASSTPTSW